jgi:hypothetical protein
MGQNQAPLGQPCGLLLDICAAICYRVAKQIVSEASLVSQQHETDLFFLKSLYERNSLSLPQLSR